MDDLAYRMARMGIGGLALVFVINKGLDPRKLLPQLFGGRPGQGRGVTLEEIGQAIRRYSYKDFFTAVVSRMNRDKRQLESESGSVGLPLGLSLEFKNDILRFG